MQHVAALAFFFCLHLGLRYANGYWYLFTSYPCAHCCRQFMFFIAAVILFTKNSKPVEWVCQVG
jgi:hypothetical protein